MDIEFLDINMMGFKTILHNINRRRLNTPICIKDPYKPSICNGMCCVGMAKTRYLNGPSTKEYSLYTGMVHRCLNENFSSYNNYGGNNVTLCDRWRCYEYFLEDLPHIDGYELWNSNPDLYQLDKDTKQPGFANKVYSLETCMFITAFKSLILESSLATWIGIGLFALFVIVSLWLICHF